jgi:hypothetical protein
LRAREVLGLEDDLVFVILNPVLRGILDFVLRHGQINAQARNLGKTDLRD